MMTTIIALSDAAQAAAAADQRLTFAEALSTGGSVIIFGLAIVFLALVALILITYVYPRVANALVRKPAEEKASADARKSDRKAETASVAAAQKAAEPADDTALIAVITAAVAASLGAPSNGIVIKSISRARQSIPAWGRSGRTEQIYNRL